MPIEWYIAILSPLPGSFFGPNAAVLVEDKGQCTFFCNCFPIETRTSLSGTRKAVKLVKAGGSGNGEHSSEASGLLTQLDRQRAIILPGLDYTNF